MDLERAQDIANRVDYAKSLALAADNYAELFQCLLSTYKAAHQCRTEWLTSGEEKHLGAAQTLAIKAALLNGLYGMRRHHKEWRTDRPVISLKALENVLPLFRRALQLCEQQSQAVQFPIKGLGPALAHLEAQVEHSLLRLRGEPDSAAFQKVACRELGWIVQQLQAVLRDGPGARRADPAEGPQAMAVPSSHGEHAAAPAHPATAGGKQPAAQPAIQAGSSRSGPAPRHDPAHPQVRPEPRPLPPRLESLRLEDRPARGLMTRPHRPGTAAGSAARPLASPPAERPALPETTPRAPLPMPAASEADEPADPAAEAAARLRQEQLASLRGALAPLRDKARHLRATAQASAGSPSGQPWALHASQFTAWQNAAQAYEACDEVLTVHAAALGLGQHHPAVRDQRREFDAALRGALAHATQAAEAALAVFLQTWQAALGQDGPAPADRDICADLAAQGRDLQQQWLQAPMRPQMPVLEARMAVLDACEAVSASQAAPDDDALELLCRATADARQACEGARGKLGRGLRTFRDACRRRRDTLLSEAVHREFNAAEARHAESIRQLQPLLDRSSAIAAAGDLLLIGDPLPAARIGGPDLPAPRPRKPAAMAAADQALIATARELAATVHAQRGQCIELPADAPARVVHEQQAAHEALRQSELAAESAAAMLASFHTLYEALPHTPLDEQPSLVRSHARAMGERCQELLRFMRAQEAAPAKDPDKQVHALVTRTCAQRRRDLRRVDTMKVVLDTLAKLLDARVFADHGCRSVAQGGRGAPGVDTDGKVHHKLNKDADDSLEVIEQHLDIERILHTADAWLEEKRWFGQARTRLEWTIAYDSAMIQAKFFLQAFAISVPTPDSVALRRLDIVEKVVPTSIALSKALAKVNKDLELQAASSLHKEEYQAQLDINKEVHRRLRAAKRQLQAALAALQSAPPVETPAGGSGQAESSLAQPARPAAHGSRPAGASGKSRARRR